MVSGDKTPTKPGTHSSRVYRMHRIPLKDLIYVGRVPHLGSPVTTFCFWITSGIRHPFHGSSRVSFFMFISKVNLLNGSNILDILIL